MSVFILVAFPALSFRGTFNPYPARGSQSFNGWSLHSFRDSVHCCLDLSFLSSAALFNRFPLISLVFFFSHLEVVNLFL